MFGKHEWFRTTNSGKALIPDCWQAWAYLAGWMGVVVAPVALFVLLGRIPESGIWLVASLLVAYLDLQKIRHKLNEPDEKELFYIDGNDQEKHVKTQNFEMHVRE